MVDLGDGGPGLFSEFCQVPDGVDGGIGVKSRGGEEVGRVSSELVRGYVVMEVDMEDRADVGGCQGGACFESGGG